MLITVDVKSPFGLTVYGDKLYWSDRRDKGLHSADKTNGSHPQVIKTNYADIWDVRMFHKNRPQGTCSQTFALWLTCNCLGRDYLKTWKENLCTLARMIKFMD